MFDEVIKHVTKTRAADYFLFLSKSFLFIQIGYARLCFFAVDFYRIEQVEEEGMDDDDKSFSILIPRVKRRH